jgi:hypothetical protein
VRSDLPDDQASRRALTIQSGHAGRCPGYGE